MTNNQLPIKSKLVLIHKLADLFNEVPPETTEEIDCELREAGYDPDEIGKRMKMIADKILSRGSTNELA